MSAKQEMESRHEFISVINRRQGLGARAEEEEEEVKLFMSLKFPLLNLQTERDFGKVLWHLSERECEERQRHITQLLLRK